MAADSNKPSFSPGRKWSIAFNVTVTTLAVFAVIVMVNYLGGEFFRRFHLSRNTRVQLAPRTLSLLQSLTNEVHVTVYCSRDSDSFTSIAELLREYTAANSKINVRYIDYDRDPGAAEDFKIRYNLGAATNKNLIAFDYAGRTNVVNGDALLQIRLVQDATADPQDQGKIALRKKPEAFLGEVMFTAALIRVSNPKPMKAYFLSGHGEHNAEALNDPMGYSKFAGVLQQNSIDFQNLSLLGTNTVPDDCSLLIIAGPKSALEPVELDRMEKFLDDGGRLLALFNVFSAEKTTGLEKLLAKWGVTVSGGVVKDPDNSSPPQGLDVIAPCGVRLPSNFNIKHPVINSLIGSRLQLILPREIDAVTTTAQTDNGFKADEILYSGPRSIIQNGGMAQRPSAKPLMVAVEKAAAKGVAAERGATRIIVAGDSIFLGNERIDSAANRDFAGAAVNWLVDRPVLLQGIGPTPLAEYRLQITSLQLRTLQWILLAAIPGGILLFGGLVWLRRRN